MLKQKMDYTLKGYIFCLLNIALTFNGHPGIGIASGIIAAAFFIKALLLKEE